jgi:hypothetical protein
MIRPFGLNTKAPLTTDGTGGAVVVAVGSHNRAKGRPATCISTLSVPANGGCVGRKGFAALIPPPLPPGTWKLGATERRKD